MIPHLIHSCWLDKVEYDNEKAPAKYNPKYDEFLESWKRFHPNHHFYWWNRRRLEGLFESPELNRWKDFWYSGLKRHIERCDFARYALLWMYGGVYRDLDYRCNKSIEPLLTGRELGLVREPLLHGLSEKLDPALTRGVDHQISNGLMMSAKRHWFWSELMDHVVQNYDPQARVVVNTGPTRMRLFCALVLHRLPFNTFIETCDIFPYDYNEQLTAECPAGSPRRAYTTSRWKDGTNWQQDGGAHSFSAEGGQMPHPMENRRGNGFRIVTEKGTMEQGGKATDVALYQKVLESLGYRVVVQSPDQAFDDGEDGMVGNLFLEHIPLGVLPKAKKNYFMINQEIGHDQSGYRYLDVILCKSRYARDLLNAYKSRSAMNWKAYHTSHTSIDRYDPRVTKDYSLALHVPGKSLNKQTDVVLQTWLHHPEYPTLHVVLNPHQIRVPYAVRHAANIILYERLPPDQLQQLQNRCGLHLCPSEAEGFGHYINEARSTRSVILTTNAPPMNELIDNTCGILISASHCVADRYSTPITPSLPGSCSFKIDTPALEQAMTAYLHLSPQQREGLGKRARERYDRDTQYMEQMLRKLWSPARQHTGTIEETPLSTGHRGKAFLIRSVSGRSPVIVAGVVALFLALLLLSKKRTQ